jgi:hypothetical protein
MSATGRSIRLAVESRSSPAVEGWRAPPRSVVEVREGVAGERPGLSGYSDHNSWTSRGTVFEGRSLRPPLFCASAGVAQSERSAAHAIRLPDARRAWPRAADITSLVGEYRDLTT